jgi:hypothetical protein
MEVKGLVNPVIRKYWLNKIGDLVICLLEAATNARINIGHFRLPTLARELSAAAGQNGSVNADSRATTGASPSLRRIEKIAAVTNDQTAFTKSERKIA